MHNLFYNDIIPLHFTVNLKMCVFFSGENATRIYRLISHATLPHC